MNDELTEKTVASTLELQVNLSPSNEHEPLLEASVKPLSSEDSLATNLAQVPEVYHVPRLMMHPFRCPLVKTSRYPRPENDLSVEDGLGYALVLVELGGVEKSLGGYLMP